MTSAFEDLLAQRRAKLQKFCDAGVPPYPARYDVSHAAREVLKTYENLEKEDSRPDILSVAGRRRLQREQVRALVDAATTVDE